jgi:anti-sigma regulatory factor (Ser/Thr protein kinase)
MTAAKRVDKAKEHQHGPDEAIREFIAQNKSGIGRLMFGVFEIRTLEEAEKLSTMLANNYPVPERVSTGLWELISNAIEHGNLGIDYAEKAALLENGDFAGEVARRLVLPKYFERVATVSFRRSKKAIRIRVRDQGVGFDHAKYMSATTFSDGPNGRGILIASKFSFDRVEYRGRGNVVDAIIDL